MFQRGKDRRQQNFNRRAIIALLLCVVGLFVVAGVGAQQNNTLPEGATVSALGRTSQVRSDGSFTISNVPSNIGRFRIRLIHPNGATAESNCLTPIDRGTTIVPPLVFGPLPDISATLTIQSSQDTFTAQGQTAQLQVTANLQGGGTADITNSLCTTYLPSNTFIASVNGSGLVTVNNMPVFPSTLLITVMNEGVIGTFSYQLQPNTDVDGDGLPNDWELRFGFNPNFAGDAGQDADVDGLTNLQEFQGGTDPRDPDTDRDGINDGSDPEPLRPETVPPTCSITSPGSGATFLEGETIIMRATANDNVGVSRVIFTSNVGGLNFTDFSAPFEAPFVIPTGVSQATINITARDIAGNTGTCPPVTINVIPDPLTTVLGRVLNQNSAPVSGASVSVLGRNGVTGADGTFSIPNVPTVQGDLVVTATFTLPDATVLTGRSAPAPPVRGGNTDVGDITVRPQVDFVYTNNNLLSANTVTAFSVAPNGTLTPIPGSPFATGGQGTGSFSLFASNRLTISVVGNFLFVANELSDNISVFTVNIATGALTLVPGSPFTTGGSSFGSGMSLGVTPDNRFLFSANTGSGSISVFNIAANGALTPITGSPFAVGGGPDGIKVSMDGKYLSVALINSDAVAMFNIGSDGSLTPVSGSPFFSPALGSAAGVEINCASSFVFVGQAVATGTHVDVFGIASNGALTPVPGSPFNNQGTGSNSNVVLLGPNDQFLFVTNQASNTITVFSVASNGSLSLIPGSPFANPGGSVPQLMAINQAGTFLYVNNDNGTLSVFSIAGNGSLTPVPGSPFAAGSSIRPGVSAFPSKRCTP